MVTLSVGNRLNKDRHFLLHDNFSCALHCEVNREQVVAIDSDCGHTVGYTSHSDTIASVLVIDWRGDGVHIVTAEKECLAAEGRSEVKSRVEITFRSRAFTEVSHSDAVLIVNTVSVATAGCLRNLGAEG